MNPMTVAQNRTARLAREATTPVYSTSTPAPKEREHLSVVEIEADTGFRWWSQPIRDELVTAYIDAQPEGYSVSDIDHAAKCWCFKA